MYCLNSSNLSSCPAEKCARSGVAATPMPSARLASLPCEAPSSRPLESRLARADSRFLAGAPAPLQLHDAAARGDVELLRRLLGQPGCDLEARCRSKLMHRRHRGHCRAMADARWPTASRCLTQPSPETRHTSQGSRRCCTRRGRNSPRHSRSSWRGAPTPTPPRPPATRWPTRARGTHRAQRRRGRPCTARRATTTQRPSACSWSTARRSTRAPRAA